MNKQKSKYFNTAFLMDEALINLLNKKDIDYITVKEICEMAGVNRSTFYLHYESIDDLLDETMEYINKKFIEYFDDTANDFINGIDTYSLDELNLIRKDYLRPYLIFIKDNKNIFRASLSNPRRMESLNRYNSLEKYIINPIMERFNIPENERKYLSSYYVHGIISIIEIWLKNGCKDDIEQLIKIIIKCVNH